MSPQLAVSPNTTANRQQTTDSKQQTEPRKFKKQKWQQFNSKKFASASKLSIAAF
jgi:hypothetical protein